MCIIIMCIIYRILDYFVAWPSLVLAHFLTLIFNLLKLSWQILFKQFPKFGTNEFGSVQLGPFGLFSYRYLLPTNIKIDNLSFNQGKTLSISSFSAVFKKTTKFEGRLYFETLEREKMLFSVVWELEKKISRLSRLDEISNPLNHM